MFPINATTGAIKVGKKIDFETTRQHMLYVQAADKGANSKKAYCTVIVEIIDTNDNAPDIEVTFIDDIVDFPTIAEDVEIGSFVAFVSVSDSDLGPAGEVEAFLVENEDFGLEVIDRATHRYIIKTLRKLDRERISDYTLTLNARDHGIPSLQSTKQVRIEISDVNDNTPYFGHAT